MWNLERCHRRGDAIFESGDAASRPVLESLWWVQQSTAFLFQGLGRNSGRYTSGRAGLGLDNWNIPSQETPGATHCAQREPVAGADRPESPPQCDGDESDAHPNSANFLLNQNG